MGEDSKKHKLRREKISLSNGFGPLTNEEKAHLLSYSLARKYDLYDKQDNATLAACVGEYLDATKEPEADTTAPEEVAEPTPLAEQSDLVEEA
jgi:hypothetical protein